MIRQSLTKRRVPPAFSPPLAEKRSATEEPDDGFQTGQEAKQQWIGDRPMNMMDVVVEEMEKNTLSRVGARKCG